jgi:Mn2+/Fe2+ NRAMP family transporter
MKIMDEITTTSGTALGTQRKGIKKVLMNYGPGIIAVLAWLGAGDLVDASVAGSHYGYDLMWALAVSLLIRFVIVNIMGRFVLCNPNKLTLLEGYGSISKFYPYFIMIFGIIMGHLFNSYMIKGSGEALAGLFGVGHPFMWSVITVLSGLFLLGRDIYTKLENLMKLLLALMTLCFIGLALWSAPDVVGIAKGVFGFGIPKDVGGYGAFLVAVSLVGAVAGSISNFLYPYFLKEKGWIGPEHKRLQRNDILFAIIMVIILDLAIWIVGAEVLKPNGIEVKNLSDLAQALAMQFGTLGFIMFYLGAFGALYSSLIGFAVGYAKFITDAFQTLKKERKEQFGGEIEKDPFYRWLVLFFLVSPIVWSIPGMPGFITMVVVVSVFSVVGIPVIAIGLLFMSNKKSLIGDYRNNWFENLILVATTILAIYSSVKIAIDLFV